MQIFNKEVPAEWLEVLRVIQSVFPQAVLAGGCLRDLVLGGEVKDLDVFVPYSNSSDKMDDLAHLSGWRLVPSSGDGDYGNLTAVVADVQDYVVPGIPSRSRWSIWIYLSGPRWQSWSAWTSGRVR
jgi:hypothetical protein